jgi:hypothetical protein
MNLLYDLVYVPFILFFKIPFHKGFFISLLVLKGFYNELLERVMKGLVIGQTLIILKPKIHASNTRIYPV